MTGDQLPLFIGMTLTSFLARYPVLAFLGRVRAPAAVLRALRFAPVAWLSAIISPEMPRLRAHFLLL